MFSSMHREERGDVNEPATVIVKALVFLLAVKLTTFNPKAITPFTAKAIALLLVI